MPRKKETLQHAITRMRREGWSEEQIQGQVHRWHPEMGSTKLTSNPHHQSLIDASRHSWETADPIAKLPVKDTGPTRAERQGFANPFTHDYHVVAPPIHATPSRNVWEADRPIHHALDILSGRRDIHGRAVDQNRVVLRRDPRVKGSRNFTAKDAIAMGMADAPLAVSGLARQIAVQAGQRAVDNPAGIAAEIGHPIRTTRQLALNTYETGRHPLRHPFDTALLGWALASGGASLAERASMLSKGQGFVRAPLEDATLQTQGGVKVSYPLSRNPIAKRVQRGRASRLQAKLDQGPRRERIPRSKLGRTFVRGLDVFGPEAKIRRELRAQRVTDEAILQGPLSQMHDAVKHLNRGEHTALRLAAIEGDGAFQNVDNLLQRHIEKAARDHADGAISSEELAAENADLKLAAATLRNPSDNFLKALDKTRNLSRETEKMLVDRGLLDSDTARGRRAKIFDLYQPGGFERAAERRALKDRLQNVDQPHAGEEGDLHAELADNIDAQKAPYTPVHHRQLRWRQSEINTRLDEIAAHKQLAAAEGRSHISAERTQAQINKLEGLLKAQKGGGAAQARTEPYSENSVQAKLDRLRAAQRDAEAAPTTGEPPVPEGHIRLYRGAGTPEEGFGYLDPTEAEMAGQWFTPERSLAEGYAETHGGKTGSVSYVDVPEEQAHEFLQGKIGGTVEGINFDEYVLPKDLASKAQPLEPPGQLPPAPDNSFYFPLSQRYTHSLLHAADSVRSGGPQPSEMGSPRASATSQIGSLQQEFTGKATQQHLPADIVARGLSQRYARTVRLTSAHDLFDRLYNAGSEVRRSEYDVPLRLTSKAREELKNVLADAQDKMEANPDAAEILSADELKALEKSITAPTEVQGAPLNGPPIKGIRWVDRRLIPDLDISERGGFQKFFDAINNPVRFADLYVRPAYALNAVGNAGMSLITQGHLSLSNTGRAFRIVSQLGEDNTAKIRAGMGESRTQSYLGGGARESRAVDKYRHTKPGRVVRWASNQSLAHMWNRLTDVWFRDSAFIHAARKAGYDTPEKIDQLLNSDSLAEARRSIFRRARKDSVDFQSMTPTEKNYIRRVVYFYPWMSRASIWALRAIIEHPGKAYTLAGLARIGGEQADKETGPQPDWLDKIGPVALGADKGRVKILNPSSVNTFSTAEQAGAAAVKTVENIIGFGSGKGGLADVATPGASFFAQQAGGGGGDPSQGFGLRALATGLPQSQALRRFGFSHDFLGGVPRAILGDPPKTYPDTGVGPALGPFVGGGFYPRSADKAVIAKQYARQGGKKKGSLADDEKFIDGLVQSGRISPEDGADMKRQAQQQYQGGSKGDDRQQVIDQMRADQYTDAEINQALKALDYAPLGG